jgi:hypothetical protein
MKKRFTAENAESAEKYKKEARTKDGTRPEVFILFVFSLRSLRSLR